MLEVVRDRAVLSRAVASLRRSSGRIGLVPTMGALHEGHRGLVVAAGEQCEAVVVSVFVNPTQFDDPADFERYPRGLDDDLALLESAGARICFAPGADQMYPVRPPDLVVDPGPVGRILEGASRPGHFQGVATVVTKLLAAVGPDRAFFGEKDYQQLVIVRRLAAELCFPVEIVGLPTSREPDGLARSSRNRLLGEDERAAAPALYRALLAGKEVLLEGGEPRAAEAVMADELERAPVVESDYSVVRSAVDLSELPERPERPERPELSGGERGSKPTPRRLLVAARVGPVRLIDNLAG